MSGKVNGRQWLRRLAMLLVPLSFLFFSLPVIAATNKDKFVVVIDAGHGGRDSGNLDSRENVYERDITLAIAKDLGKQIKKKVSNCEVRFTHEKDVATGLKARSDYANRVKGNLFISLHVNTSSNPNETGFKAYVLDREGDANGRTQAIRENSAIIGENNYKQIYGDFNPLKEDFKDFNMPDALTMHFSNKFAEFSKKTMAAMGRSSLGVSKGPFWILSSVNMPGAVLELGFVSNPEERKFLASKKGQEKLALALCNAVVEYVTYYRTVDRSKLKLDDSVADSDDNFNGVVLETAQDSEVKVHNPNTNNNHRTTTAKRKRRSKIVYEEGAENFANSNTNYDNEDSTETDTANASSVNGTGSSADNVINLQKPARKERNKKDRTKKQKVKKYYTILLYSSKDRLDANNIAFKGYKPDSFIHENNLYNYTYGESENKKEMETLLVDVRKRIPDAKIIQIRK